MVHETRSLESGEKQQMRIMVDMTASLLHHGHVRLLKRAKEMGYVVVALTTDDEIERNKGYKPELSYEERREILLALRYVDEVVPSAWLIDDACIRKHNIDLLLHGDDNANPIEIAQTYARTVGVSSHEMRERAAAALVTRANSQKCLLTPGPTNLHPENLAGIRPVFTRGDTEYTEIENTVLPRILARAGQDSIVCMQGSATTAIEVATTNFLYGNVLIVVSGYYSQRIAHMLERKQDFLKLSNLTAVSYADFLKNIETFKAIDWIVAVSTETADAFLSDIPEFRRVADRTRAKLMIDATGSINLEEHHELADACIFSSCKGLGGLTGAGFITYNRALLENLNSSPKAFILDLNTYLEKKTTGPAHALSSLYQVSERFSEYGERVKESKCAFMKKFERFLIGSSNQPRLCTKFKATTVKVPPHTVMYQPRSIEPGYHVICHLFDQFPAGRRVGDFYNQIEIS